MCSLPRPQFLNADKRKASDLFMKSTARKVETLVEPSLKESELRYRRLFETAQDGILILDSKTGAITDVNPFLVYLLGYSREEFT